MTTGDEPHPPNTDDIDRAAIERALDGVVAGSLRPVCVGLGLFYALLSAWYVTRLEGPALANLVMASGLMAFGLVVGAVWFERNEVPEKLGHPIAGFIGSAVILHGLLMLVSVPEARMTTHLMVLQVGFGALLLSVKWFIALSVVSFAGWAWVVGGRAEDPLWYHFGLALGEATLFGLLVLVVRIRAYENIQKLRLRDQILVTQLREANQAALAAVKAKSEFLANMSHEIRTPMTAMLGMTELLQMTELDESQKEFASTIQRSGNTLLQLVNDILDFSKFEAGHLALEEVTFDLRALLEEVRELLEVKARQRGLELQVEVDAGMPRRFRGDPTRIRQVLVNLTGNAIKFTHEGKVVLRASAKPSDEAHYRVEIDVEDSGIGIPADQLEHIFDAFTQADASTTRKFGGTGLGLAISKQLVRLMRGELTVQSEPGEGSVFTVSLVLPAVERRSTLPVADAGAAEARFEGRVLLVEDNADNQALATQMLEHMGCQVEWVPDGGAAITRLDEQRYDLVLMDCQMPDVNGYEATREIRRREGGNGPRVPIVALSASVLPEERARCVEVGMDDFVAKPFSRQDLRGVLTRWLPGGPQSAHFASLSD